VKLKKGPPDFVLFLATLTLIGIGLIMVFSSSAVTSGVRYDDPYHYFKRQLLWAVIGFLVMITVMRIDYRWIRSKIVLLFGISVVCLVLVITPLGIEVNGAKRWLGVGSLVFSPAELAKISMVLFMAHSLDKNISKIKYFWKGVAPYLAILGLVAGCIMAQPDLGTSIAIAGTVYFLLLVAGVRWSHLASLAIAGVALVGVAIAIAPYRMERFIAFLDPWKYANDEGFQTIQSLYALGSGGLFGMGLGRSRQKFFYLPEQHTDFIFAILGEELGFIGAMLVIILFLLFAWRGFRIAMNAPDNFTSLLAAGLTIMIVFQAAINIGVVSGALPVTGITLPFISYGGTSLLFTMTGVGLLLNISRYCS